MHLQCNLMCLRKMEMLGMEVFIKYLIGACKMFIYCKFEIRSFFKKEKSYKNVQKINIQKYKFNKMHLATYFIMYHIKPKVCKKIILYISQLKI